MDHVYALLLAGGKGTRFWPLSREDHPKQLLKLFSDKTLVEETYERIISLIPNERIFVATSETLLSQLKDFLPDIPEQNFIPEPVPRNTAPCIAVAARLVNEIDKESIMVVLPSDHFIADQETFLSVLQSAIFHAGRDKIVTIGVTPTHPETGYGYIKFGELEQVQGHPEIKHRARVVLEFVEKPDHTTALSYLKAGRYLWNSGMFVFKSEVILEKIKTFLPNLFEAVNELLVVGLTKTKENRNIWEKMPDISIDYGIMEKIKDGIVIPSSFGWSDVGSWAALSAFPTDDDQNFSYGKVVTYDAKGNVLWSSSGLLAALGVSNMVVVSTHGAVLVCPIDRTQDVKKLVDLLKRKNLTEYL